MFGVAVRGRADPILITPVNGDGKNMRRKTATGLIALALWTSLQAGCMNSGFLPNGKAVGHSDVPMRAQDAAQVQKDNSEIIETLQRRQSAILPNSAFAQIADAVMANDARVAQSELLAARLRASAKSKNWLPSICPSISLTSLGDFVANLVVEQVLFDNGRKKAERAFAKAEVEVAAVTLVEGANKRVHDALSLYLNAQEGREIAAISETVLLDMRRFKWIMNERVKGGVSDMSDLNILNQKLAEIEAEQRSGGEKTQTALAELNAMSARNLNDVTGSGSLGPIQQNDAVSVIRAQAEQGRDIASIDMERAGALPSITATASGGSTKPAMQIGTSGLFDFGTGDRLRAADAAKTATERKVVQARETANRTLQSLMQKLAAERRAAAETAELAARAKANLDLFQTQYEEGQRQVMDVVGVYETFARQQRAQITHKYQAARLELAIARELGALADGEDI